MPKALIKCKLCNINPPRPRRGVCDKCEWAYRKKGGQKWRRWREEKLRLGLCTRCGQQPICEESQVSCRTCYNKRVERFDKHAAFKYLGNKCACCGIDDIRFLTLDHVNNDGRVDVRHGFYRQVVLQERTDIQLLCWNCNMAKGIYRGTCPHQILIEGDSWNAVK